MWHDERVRTWVLLHGTPLTPAVWSPVAAHLDGAVVTPDLTRVPAGAQPQRRLAASVVDELPEGEWDVVGHSFGGQVALELALAAGERVRSLTILCSRDTPVPAFAAVADAVASGDAPSVDAGLARWFTATELDANGPAVRAARSDLAAAVASPTSWARALAGIAVFDRSHDLFEVQVEVALHAAGLDRVSTPEAMTAFASRLSNAHCTVHDEWAHMSPFVDPAALAATIAVSRA